MAKTKSVDRAIAETLGLPTSNVHLTAEEYRELLALLEEMRDALQGSECYSEVGCRASGRTHCRCDNVLARVDEFLKDRP